MDKPKPKRKCPVCNSTKFEGDLFKKCRNCGYINDRRENGQDN